MPFFAEKKTSGAAMSPNAATIRLGTSAEPAFQRCLGLEHGAVNRIMDPPARCFALQVHLTLYPPGSFRTGNVDGADCHFAFRTEDFDGALATLTANGFREDATHDDPMHVMVRRNGPAGFPQLFLLDPDRNIIEINGAPRL
jgi:hypothetical protein